MGVYGVLCFLRMSECCVVLIQMEPLVSNLILIQVQVRSPLRHPMTTLTGKPRHTIDHGITAVDHGTLVLEGLIVSQKRVTCKGRCHYVAFTFEIINVVLIPHHYTSIQF